MLEMSLAVMLVIDITVPSLPRHLCIKATVLNVQVYLVRLDFMAS